MAKLVRLKMNEMREWNRNQSFLVDDVGTPVRPVSSREQMVMFELSKHVARTKQPMSTKTPEEPSTVAAELEKFPGSNHFAVKFLIDNLAVVGGRELMKARYLREHGECQLRTVTGKFLTAVRDPRAIRPTAKEAERTTPTPDNCMCAKWALSDGTMHPGKHHPVCQYNEKAPVEERGTFSDQATATVTPVFANIATTPTVPSPEACHCKPWALPDGTAKAPDVHHPICEFKEAWEMANQAKFMVMSLETGQVMREATADEITQAEEAEKTSGSMVIDIGGQMYGVVTDAEVATEEEIETV